MPKEETTIPKHVGLIMDGNGRWATKRGLPRNAGHKVGADVFEKIARHALKVGISHFTVFAFSTENFGRPAEEVDGIIGLMRSYLNNQKRRQNKDVRLRFLGDIGELPPDMQQDILELEERTSLFDKLNLNIAFNYGGRQDLLRAAKQLATDYKSGKVADLAEITEDDFAMLLYTQDQPEVDLLIRTSGEERISNFLLWQCAYAEFLFIPTLWPDFSTQEFDQALGVYSQRHRRHGGV